MSPFFFAVETIRKFILPTTSLVGSNFSSHFVLTVNTTNLHTFLTFTHYTIVSNQFFSIVTMKVKSNGELPTYDKEKALISS